MHESLEGYPAAATNGWLLSSHTVLPLPGRDRVRHCHWRLPLPYHHRCICYPLHLHGVGCRQQGQCDCNFQFSKLNWAQSCQHHCWTWRRLYVCYKYSWSKFQRSYNNCLRYNTVSAIFYSNIHPCIADNNTYGPLYNWSLWFWWFN